MSSIKPTQNSVFYPQALAAVRKDPNNAKLIQAVKGELDLSKLRPQAQKAVYTEKPELVKTATIAPAIPRGYRLIKGSHTKLEYQTWPLTFKGWMVRPASKKVQDAYTTACKTHIQAKKQLSDCVNHKLREYQKPARENAKKILRSLVKQRCLRTQTAQEAAANGKLFMEMASQKVFGRKVAKEAAANGKLFMEMASQKVFGRKAAQEAAEKALLWSKRKPNILKRAYQGIFDTCKEVYTFARQVDAKIIWFFVKQFQAQNAAASRKTPALAVTTTPAIPKPISLTAAPAQAKTTPAADTPEAFTATKANTRQRRNSWPVAPETTASPRPRRNSAPGSIDSELTPAPKPTSAASTTTAPVQAETTSADTKAPAATAKADADAKAPVSSEKASIISRIWQTAKAAISTTFATAQVVLSGTWSILTTVISPITASARKLTALLFPKKELKA